MSTKTPPKKATTTAAKPSESGTAATLARLEAIQSQLERIEQESRQNATQAAEKATQALIKLIDQATTEAQKQKKQPVGEWLSKIFKNLKF